MVIRQKQEPLAILGRLGLSAHRLDKCVIVVTHSNALAMEADVVMRLKRGRFQIVNNEYFILTRLKYPHKELF